MPGRPTNEPGNYFAIGRQTAKDTEATTFHFIKHLDGTGFDVDPDIQTEREGGDGQEASLRYRSFIKADGQYAVNARPGIAGRSFAYCLGGDSYASIAASYGTHDISPVASIPYTTVEQKYADVAERVINTQLNTLELAGEAGRPLKLNVGFVGGGSNYARDAAASALTPVRESVAPLFFPNATYRIDGTTSTKLTKFSLKVNRSVDDGIQTTGLTREDVVALNLDIDLEGTLKYEDKTLYSKIEYNGGTIVPFRLATGSFEVFVQDGSTALNVILPLLEYTNAVVNRLDPDGKTVYLDFTAATIKGATNPITAKVTAVDVATSYLSAP